MADLQIRVLFRWVNGLPWRQASEEERKETSEQAGVMLEKWKASGVKLLADFNVAGNAVDDFAHFWIYEVPDVAMVREMTQDITRIGKHMEKFSLNVGWGYPGLLED
jgi:hypothetical protein